MNRRRRLAARVTTAILGVVLVGVGAGTPAGAAASTGDRANAIGRPNPSLVVPFTLVLRFPGTLDLERYLAAQRGTGSPASLTPAQIGDRFGLPTARLDALIAQLAHAGITVTKRFDQRTALLAKGSVRSVEQLFGMRLDEQRGAHGSSVRVPSGPIHIPPDLTDAVAQVEGLDTRPAFHSHAAPRLLQAAQTQRAPLLPTTLTRIYGGDALTKTAKIDGTGETIAIASLATVHGAEFSKWAGHFKTHTQPVEDVTVDPAAPTASEQGWSPDASQEVAMDLEMSRAVAPGAALINYTTTNDDAGLTRIVNQVAQDHRATILTISWGSCELASDPATIQNDEATYAAAEAAGVDIYVASGDTGPYDCNDQKHQSDRHVSVDYPASSDHVAGVGGTTIVPRGKGFAEEAWQEPVGIGGAGGGLSAIQPRPAFQLASVVRDPSSARAVPDLAGPASPTINLEIVLYDASTNSDRLAIAGGTSASAPFWAGVTALTKQYLRARVGHVPDGTMKTLLYQVANSPDSYKASFHDVTVGNNDQFSAAPGWDFITGLGSPRISGLALALETLLRSSG